MTWPPLLTIRRRLGQSRSAARRLAQGGRAKLPVIGDWSVYLDLICMAEVRQARIALHFSETAHQRCRSRPQT
jgi:hypothetical protein